MKIKDLRNDEFIYPRNKTNKKTVEAYKSSIEAGAEFPPIEVQAVSNYGEKEIDTTLILDGVHRWEAYKELDKEDVVVTHWQKERIDYEENKIELLARAAVLNKKHGDRTSKKDKETVAKRIAENDPDSNKTIEWIAEQLGASYGSVQGWVKEIRSRQRASKENNIYRLSKMGFTQEKISEAVDISRSRISEIVGNIKSDNIDNLRGQGNDMPWIAEHLGIDLTLAWSYYLEDKTDEERMDELGLTIKKYTVWNYSGANDLMGRSSFDGRIPGEIVANALYWFTNQGDLVVDPMAGSGTTVDACLLMGRDCRAYDINPFRKDIIENDITSGFPSGIDNVDFVFVDPPYWNIKNYGQDYPLEKFYDMIEKLALSCLEALKDGGQVAVLMGNQAAQQWLPAGTHRLDHVQKEHDIFKSVGFKKRWGIYCPLPTEGAQRWAQKEWDNHRMGEITRELTIWEK